ncbi:hypothetical protein ACF0H5_001491 [Mactra antiquata]
MAKTGDEVDETREDVSPDEIIEELGGCGRYQIRMSVTVHLLKTIMCFTFMGMIFFSATPNWWCLGNVGYGNSSTCLHSDNNKSSPNCAFKSCNGVNGTHCYKYEYDTQVISTIVNEFDLVCDQDFIPSTISTIQIGGTLVGNIMAGQIADMFGRKPPFFTALVIVSAFNLLGFFSTSWKIFAVARFFAGLGGGFFMTTQYCLLSEFSLAKWRVWIVGFPSWPIQTCLFALLSWLLHDWRYIQLMTAIIALPCLLTWFIIPESFRWYIAHDKPKKAEVIIRSVARYNRHESFDAQKILSKVETKNYQKYSPLDLFKTKQLVKVTLLSSLNWMALGLVSYGLSFGIQSLSGNIYLNLFLFSLVGIPSKGLALWLQNRSGRRNTSIGCYLTIVTGGSIVGIVQSFNVQYKDELTNAFALFAYIGVTTAWGPVQTMTIELYPTVIRNIGFGTLSVAGRIGAMIGPQLVYLNTYVPGLLYYSCAAISALCTVGLIFLPETKDGYLSDKIQHTNTVPQRLSDDVTDDKKHESVSDAKSDVKIKTSSEPVQIFVLGNVKAGET